MRPAALRRGHSARSRWYLPAVIGFLVPAVLAGWTLTAVFAETPSPSASAAQLPGADPNNGATVFGSAGCSSCHGANLEGGIGPRLNPITHLSGVTNPLDPNFLITTITNGRPGTPMAAYGGKLSDQQIKDLAAFIIQQNSLGSGGLTPEELARSNVFWISVAILLMVLVTFLLARYNMRWIDRRAAARRERERLP